MGQGQDEQGDQDEQGNRPLDGKTQNTSLIYQVFHIFSL
jgi:hypothetical protein